MTAYLINGVLQHSELQEGSQTRAATRPPIACEAGVQQTQQQAQTALDLAVIVHTPKGPLPLSQLPFIVESQEAPVDEDELVTHVTVGGMGLP